MQTTKQTLTISMVILGLASSTSAVIVATVATGRSSASKQLKASQVCLKPSYRKPKSVPKFFAARTPSTATTLRHTWHLPGVHLHHLQPIRRQSPSVVVTAHSRLFLLRLPQTTSLFSIVERHIISSITRTTSSPSNLPQPSSTLARKMTNFKLKELEQL